MADGLGVERSSFVEDLIEEVTKSFEPLARREWLEWGGDLLFVSYKAQIEAEDRAMVEQKRREEEEVERQRAADEKAKKLQERREVLRVARGRAIAEFREKTLSKEGLKAHNAELEVEAQAIDREENAGVNGGEMENEEEETEERRDVERREEGHEDEEYDGLPVVRMRKRKAVAVEEDEGEDEHDELDEETVGGEGKRVRHEEGGLLVFKGPVSFIQSISTLLKMFVVRSMRFPQGRATVRRGGGSPEVQSMH
jgi:hypothetical protein